MTTFLCPMQNDASGEKLKDLAIEMNITPSAIEYIKTKVPSSRCVCGCVAFVLMELPLSFLSLITSISNFQCNA